MANILKELFRREGKDNSSATNKCYEISVDAKNVVLSSEEDDKREAYTNLADKLKIFNKMNNIRLTATEDLKKIGNASGDLSHAEGASTQATNYAAHAEGVGTVASGNGSHAEGHNTEASNQDAHAEGYTSIASGYASHAEGSYFGTFGASDMQRTIASGPASHAEGTGTQAKGGGSHSEGVKTVAEGEASHAEGSITQALAKWSHAEGVGTTVEEAAKGGHAEGRGTVVGDEAAHAEGFESKALGYITHAEGWKTEARAQGSHTEGLGTIAAGKYQHVQGKYNVEDTADSNGYGQYAHIVGWGASDQRANIHTLSTKGDAWFAGNISAGKENEDSKIKGNLVVDGKITAKLGLVNETGSQDFKTENLQVDKVAIFGEGHHIPDQDSQWEESLFEKSGLIEINKGEYLTFERLNILNSPGTLEWEANKPLSAYYGTILSGSLLGAENGIYEARLTWYGANTYYPIFFKIDKPNFIIYAPKDEMSGSFSLNVSKEAFLNFKYVLKEANAFKNSGVLIQGQFSDLSSDESKSLIHIVGGGTSKENRNNIYTLDKNGNAEFFGSIKNLGGLHTQSAVIGNFEAEDDITSAILKDDSKWKGIMIQGIGHKIQKDKWYTTYISNIGQEIIPSGYRISISKPHNSPFPFYVKDTSSIYQYAFTYESSTANSVAITGDYDKWYKGTLRISKGIYYNSFFIRRGPGYQDDFVIYTTEQLTDSDFKDGTVTFIGTSFYYKDKQEKEFVGISQGGFVQGCFSDLEEAQNYACIIGGGGSDQNRKNIYCLDWSGNAEYSGDVAATINGEKISISDLLNRIKALENK